MIDGVMDEVIEMLLDGVLKLLWVVYDVFKKGWEV